MNTLLVLLALLYLPGCILAANVAGWRGLRSSGWFFAALVCTPLIAILGIIATPQDLDRAPWDDGEPKPPAAH